MAVQYLPLSWETYHTLSLKIAATILSHSEPIDGIVAIARGGLTFGHLLSDFLRIPISTITIQSYSDIQTQGNITVTAELQTPIKNKHILLVDDVADSGKTLVRGVEYVKSFKPKKVTTVTMFYKAHSVYRPDYFAKQTNKWIMFPYEATENILLTTKQWQKEGKSKAQIQEFLENLHYKDEQINFVRKYHINKT